MSTQAQSKRRARRSKWQFYDRLVGRHRRRVCWMANGNVLWVDWRPFRQREEAR
jgi:hypothetical protein